MAASSRSSSVQHRRRARSESVRRHLLAARSPCVFNARPIVFSLTAACRQRTGREHERSCPRICDLRQFTQDLDGKTSTMARDAHGSTSSLTPGSTTTAARVEIESRPSVPPATRLAARTAAATARSAATVAGCPCYCTGRSRREQLAELLRGSVIAARRSRVRPPRALGRGPLVASRVALPVAIAYASHAASRDRAPDAPSRAGVGLDGA